MSWGITCNDKGRNVQLLREPLCLTMVALEPCDTANDEKVSLLVKVEDNERLICTLIHGKLMQQPVKLKFREHEVLEFFVKGNGTLHILGYIVTRFMNFPFNDIYGLDSDEYVSEDEKLDAKRLLSLDDIDDDDSDESWKPPVDDFDDFFMHNVFNDDLTLRSNFDDIKATKGSITKKKNFVENSFYPNESYVPPVKANDVDANSNDKESDGDKSEIEQENVNEENESSDDNEDIEEKPVSKKRKSKLNDNQPKRAKIMGPPEIKSAQGMKLKKSKKHKAKKHEAMKHEEINHEAKKHEAMKHEAMKHEAKKNAAKENESNKNEISHEGADMNSSVGRTPMPKKKKMIFINPMAIAKGIEKPPPSFVSSIEGTAETHMIFPKKLPCGLEYNDLVLGSGPLAKKGNIVHVHYVGRLLNGKIFVQCNPPKKPFSFRLGLDDYIKGWNVGIEGMKVGGKRELKIPPNMAYGKTGRGPIRPYATLLFTIELKNVTK